MSAALKLIQSSEISGQKQQKNNRRILIVEDEAAIAEGILNILCPDKNVIPLRRSSRQASGSAATSTTEILRDQFEVTWAKNPEEALKATKLALENGSPFAMGFFDVMLGSDIDGIELVRQIHLIDPKLYAVFVTAYHDRSVDSINQILGASKSDRWDYINKPFSEGEILQKARNVTSIWNLREDKRLQDEQLAEAAKLLLQGERTNTVAAVGRSVAHEFGNMLMQIVGHAEIAILNKDESKMKAALETILTAAETAAAVLGKFKKLNEGDESKSMSKINLNRCLNEAVDLIGPELKKRSIQVQRLQFDPVELEANYHSLVQVFMNIFINASYVMPRQGQLDLSIRKLSSENVEIRIRDYGPGIPEEILSRVTEALFTTKGSQGSGLGLSICKEIIEIEHQGEMTIQNHPEKGLEICLLLPICQEA